MEAVEIPPKDEEELALERLVFGDWDNFESNLRNLDNLHEQEESEEETIESDNSDIDDSEDGFFIDDGEMEVDDAMEQDSQTDTENESEGAWSDSEDEKAVISLKSSDRLKKLRKYTEDDSIDGKSYVKRLRSQFEKIYPRPEWPEKLEAAEQEEDEQEEDVSGNTNTLLKILNNTDKFTVTKQLKLISAHKIAMSRLKDANISRRSKSGIQALSFHKSQPLILTAGFDRTMRIYHIDGSKNNLVTSLFLHDVPIYSAQFGSGNVIFAGGRRKYMHKWDLTSSTVEKISRMYGQEKFQKSMEQFKVSPGGKYVGLVGSGGHLNLLNGSTGQFVKNFKIEGVIADFAITRNDQVIIIINKAGEAWEFNLSTDELIKRWQDDSGIGITTIQLGGRDDRYMAVGTNTGIVNIYDRASSNAKPIKAIENLITTISTLQFNHDGQILVIASRAKRDALRLVHVATGTVYSNWPTSGTPLGKVTAVDFSPDSSLMAVGNDQGKVTLWRLNHY